MKTNKAAVGIALQKQICVSFGIKLLPAQERFFSSATYDPKVLNALMAKVRFTLAKIGSNPVACTTKCFSKKAGETFLPYNFLLSNGKTLTIDAPLKSALVCPAVVGQCGYDTLNHYFGDIYGQTISEKEQFKDLVRRHIAEMLPTFIDYLFAADYTVMLYEDAKESDGIRCEVVTAEERNKCIDIDFDPANFSIGEKWNECTILKYLGNISLAEVQVHKNRNFKFRFSIKAIVSLIKRQIENNETLGITAEKTICDIFGLSYKPDIATRASVSLESRIEATLKSAFSSLPAAVEYTGDKKGPNGGQDKSPYDFILSGGKTLSLKTNLHGSKVCPPEVGQPGPKTFVRNFKSLMTTDAISYKTFKELVFANVEKMMPIYVHHLFDSDYLLWISLDQLSAYILVPKFFGKDFVWQKESFSFSKPTIEDWNVSNTVRYDGVVLGEFELTKTRICYKFRFELPNLIAILKKEKE
jgi:hypothetical protein